MRDKVMFLRLGALGDILVSLSALEKVVHANSGKNIVICGNALWLEIMRAYPQFGIRQIYVLRDKYQLEEFIWQNDWQSTGHRTSFYHVAREAQIIYNLRFESLRYSWHSFFARVPVRYGSSPRFFRFLFTHWFGWLREEPPIHERDWLNAIVTAPLRNEGKYRTLGYNLELLRKQTGLKTYRELNADFLPEMTLPANTADVLRRYSLKAKEYILLNPTASRRDKAWPAENFRLLFEFLQQALPEQTICIIGSPAETDWLREVAAANTIIQPLSLADLFHVVKNATALIANTSSMQFIASAVQVPTLTLMGWADPIRWGPLGAQNIVIKGKDIQADDKFKRDEEAYRSITIDEVKNISIAWLKTLI